MKNLIIIGAGDWGLEVWAWLEDAVGYGQDFVFKGFLDKNPDALAQIKFCNAPILDSVTDYEPNQNDVFICTIADPIRKEMVTSIIAEKGGVFINLIHKSVIFFKNVQLGHGIILSPNCIVSNNCKIENHVAINLACTLGHDVEVGAFSQISSQCDLTGHVKIGKQCFMGSKVSIIPKVTVADGMRIGAGSIVLRNLLKPGISVFGNPAKEIL